MAILSLFMKILHIEDRFHPEMGYQLNFFSKYHNPEDELIILSSTSFSLWEGSDARQIMEVKDKEFERKYNVKIIRIPARLDRKGKYNIWLKGLIKAILEINPDIVYTHAIETYTSIRVILSRKVRKNFVIVSDTHSLLNQFSSDLRFRLAFWFYKKIIISLVNRNNIRVFYTTEENRIILCEHYQIKRNLIESALIGTDSSVYYYDEKFRTSEREKLTIGPEDFVLLYTGKFSNTKQPHLILEAISYIKDRIKRKLWLVFVGAADQKYMNEYFKGTINTDLIKTLILPAVKNTELYKYYSMADLAVFPKENTLSALDVQSCRLPVIMEDDFTNRERLSAGGKLFEKNNTADLGNQILSLIDNPAELKSLASAGQQFVLENYDYKAIIKKMESVLYKNLESKKS